jgi:hypothetical protein
MSTCRQQGPTCPTRVTQDVKDGTSCRALMHKPGHTCYLQKPIWGHQGHEVQFLKAWLEDARWQRTEAKGIYRDLGIEVRLEQGANPKKGEPKKEAFSSILKKNAKDALLDPLKTAFKPTTEGRELREELLSLLKQGAKVARIRGKLATRIRQFLKISALKGCVRKNTLQKLKRDLKGFGIKHLKDMAKGLAIGVFLDWSQSFVMKSAEEQMGNARTDGEKGAALFLAADALILKAGSDMTDVSFWWSVAKDLRGSYRAGKLKSISGAWTAWSDAVTRDHEQSESKGRVSEVGVRLPVKALDHEIIWTKRSLEIGRSRP